MAAEHQVGMVTPELAGDLRALFSATCMAPAPTRIPPFSFPAFLDSSTCT